MDGQPDVRTRLIAVATEEFLDYGFAEANVGRIAAAAGISKKTVYKHIPSKEALFRAVLESRLRLPALALEARRKNFTPREGLSAYLRAFAELAFSREGIQSYRLMLSEGARFPDMARIYMSAVHTLGVGRLAEELSSHNKAGHLRVADASMAASMLMAMVFADPMRNAAIGIAPPPTKADIEVLIATAVDIFLKGTHPGSH